MYNLLETSAEQSVKDLRVYANKERQRRLKGGKPCVGVVPSFPAEPLYLISSSDELLIIISGSVDFFPTSSKFAAFTE